MVDTTAKQIGKEPLVLLRVVETEYVDDIINGQYSFTSLEKYRKMEEQENDEELGDVKEGILNNIYRNISLELISRKTKICVMK